MSRPIVSRVRHLLSGLYSEWRAAPSGLIARHLLSTLIVSRERHLLGRLMGGRERHLLCRLVGG